MTSHLKEFLDYYKQRDAPGYAVLVTGDWGTGKTYQVKAALAEEEVIYVSLFGLRTADEVHASVLTEAITASSAETIKTWTPEKDFIKRLRVLIDRIGNRRGRMAKDMGRALLLGNAPAWITKAVASSSAESMKRVLIFDDLERSSLEDKEISGIVNKYVEHHGCKVIVLTHENELGEYLQKTKEKIFGHRVKVTPQIDDAFAHFCSEINTEHRGLIESHKSNIVNHYRLSPVASGLECNSRYFMMISSVTLPDVVEKYPRAQNLCPQ